MSVNTTIEFDDLTEHSFDATKIELSDDKAKLTSIVPASENLFFNFDTDASLAPKRGTYNMVLGGVDSNGAIIGGVLDLTGADSSFGKISNYTEIVTDFASRFVCQVNFATIGSNMDIFRVKSNIDNSSIVFYLQNQGGGVTRIRAREYTAAGAIITDHLVGTRTLAIGMDLELAFSFDDDGNTSFFLDGILSVFNISGDGDFSDVDLLFGYEDTSNCNYTIDNFQFFLTDFYTADYTSPVPEPTTYSIEEETIFTIIPLVVDELLDFICTKDMMMGSVMNFININGDYYYYNGTAWVESNGTLMQANDSMTFQANLSTLPIIPGIGATVQIASIMKSASGYTTPWIESYYIKYSYKFRADDINKCTVYGTVLDNAGDPIVGVIIVAQSNDKFYSGAFIGPKSSATTNAKGKWSMSVVETETANTGVDFFIKYDEDGEEIEFPFKDKVVPNLPTVKLSDLLTVV